ncbi:MAG: ATP-binding protein, partial [Candidatus Korarchaeota archaeon]
MSEIIGQVVGGNSLSLQIRVKSSEIIELEDLLAVDDKDHTFLLYVDDIAYRSQHPQNIIELTAGLKVEGKVNEEDVGLSFIEPELRNYRIIAARILATITRNISRTAKKIPPFLSNVRRVRKDDLGFLTKPQNPVYIGKVRSGSKVL